MSGFNLQFYLLKVKDHSYIGFCSTEIVGGLMDIIKVYWKNKMLKACTVVCLVQIIVSKCVSIMVCQFCQSKSYQKCEQEISDGQTVADDIRELFQGDRENWQCISLSHVRGRFPLSSMK